MTFCSTTTTISHPPRRQVRIRPPDYLDWPRISDVSSRNDITGYKVTAVKSVEEYANLDANDESLNRWKASLGIVPGASAPATGPKVRSSR
jgi:hypothetical protein